MHYFVEYLSFLNSLGLPSQFKKILEIEPHKANYNNGWRGLESLVCLDQKEELYDVDIRYAWDSVIFQQNLIDHGWSETILLTKKLEDEPNRHKVIIYLCENSTKMNVRQKLAIVPERFIIGSYWQTISHCYLLLPRKHPFELKITQKQITSVSYSDKSNFLTTEKPTHKQKNAHCLKTQFFLPPDTQRIGEGGLRTKGLYKTSRDKLPLISVITVVFNGERYLEQTIQSVINSSYLNLEYIVIDGASTDNSLKIIKKYENQIDYWVSEPDSGIYDAMNKGTIVSLGSHTLHINADDFIFDSQALEERIKESLAKEKDLYSLNLLSSILFYRLDKKELVKKTPKQPHKNRDMNILHVPVGHQGFIGLKTSLSIFDTSYQITAARGVIANKTSQEKINLSSRTIAICRSGGISYGFNPKISTEIRRAVSNYKNIKIIFNLFWRDTYAKLLQLAKVTGLIKIKKKILG
ncbi:MAG: glycosyltransferase [Xenococcaceae cyanobacterium MO_188.B32]|nr:glycosyltransferase [Xenococcaceae cyanobacterium MO_188.B32]